MHSKRKEASMRLVLVACSALKLPHAAAARDLYGTSDLFSKSRSYAEQLIANGQADDWRILSGAHGVLHPDTVIAPYQLGVQQMSAAERRVWAEAIAGSLEALSPSAVTVLGGVHYVAAVARYAAAAGIPIDTPLGRLEIGERKAWLKRQLAA
jgi:hypothetical protein